MFNIHAIARLIGIIWFHPMGEKKIEAFYNKYVLDKSKFMRYREEYKKYMLAKPSKQQYEWHELERSMFISISPGTWQGQEYDDLSTPLSMINPQKLDTDQWCEVAASWGARLVLFVAKHVGGFCWWQTDTTEYSVKNTPWKNGKGDVLTDLSCSCRKYGLKLGIYVYPGDKYNGSYLGSAGRTVDPAKQEAYNQMYRQQLTEVLSRYGEISEVWFDGSCIIPVGDIIEKYTPNAAVFQSKHATIRWVGNEEGYIPYPGWNSLLSSDLKSGLSTAFHSNPDGDAWAPIEVDVPLYNHNWFWSRENEKKRRRLDELIEIYYKSAGYGGVLLLNSSPNTDGLIPEEDVKAYKALGAEIERRFGNSIAEVIGTGSIVELPFSEGKLINHCIIMEDYREGERIREYAVEGLINGQWVELCSGSAVGRKKIDFFPDIFVKAVRLHVRKCSAQPLIRKLSVFNTTLPTWDLAKALENEWKTVCEWTKDNIESNGIFDIDLSHEIRMAGQYELKLTTGGKGDLMLEIKHFTLVLEGYETPDMLTALDMPYTYNINRTAALDENGKGETIARFYIENTDGFSAGKAIIRKR